MMSRRGPAEAWERGRRPAAWEWEGRGGLSRGEMQGMEDGNGTNHELNDVDSEMLIHHRADPHRSFP